MQDHTDVIKARRELTKIKAVLPKPLYTAAEESLTEAFDKADRFGILSDAGESALETARYLMTSNYLRQFFGVLVAAVLFTGCGKDGDNQQGHDIPSTAAFVDSGLESGTMAVEGENVVYTAETCDHDFRPIEGRCERPVASFPRLTTVHREVFVRYVALTEGE